MKHGGAGYPLGATTNHPALAGGSTHMGWAACVPVGHVLALLCALSEQPGQQDAAGGPFLGRHPDASGVWAHSLPPLSHPSLQPHVQAHLHAQAHPRAQARLSARTAPGTCLPVPTASDGGRRCGPLEEAGASPERKTIEALWPARVNHITPLLDLEKPGRLAAQNNKLFHCCTQRRTRGHLKQEPAPA